MSNVSSEPTTNKVHEPAKVPWNPWLALLFVVIIYYATQIFGGLVVSVYPAFNDWTDAQATTWLNDSVGAQFAYILIAETCAIGAIYLFLRRHKLGFSSIGLKRPRWSDPAYGLLAVPAYFILLAISIAVVSYFVPGFNAEQEQQIGFENVSGGLALLLTFISLVIIPPIAEEIMMRGFLYTSLKKALRLVPAVLLTSIVFALAHLPQGGAAGPLYIATLDTFVLSLVLIYLREKTGSLWAPITLHAAKNCIAFVALFVLQIR